MEEKCEAVVVGKRGNAIVLRVVKPENRESYCSKCRFRTFCKNYSEDKDSLWIIPTKEEFNVGDKVEVFVPERQLIAVAFLVFASPLIAPIAVLALTNNIFLTILAFFLSIFILKIFDKDLAAIVVKPRIVKKSTEEEISAYYGLEKNKNAGL